MTFGYKGSKGGIASGLKGPADAPLFVGIEEAAQPNVYRCLPFFDSASADLAADDFDIEGLRDYQYAPAVFPFADREIKRTMGATLDVWQAGDMTFTTYSPIRPVPDPSDAEEEALRLALVPAMIVDLKIDNSKCDRPRKAFFGYGGADRQHAIRVWEKDGLIGVAQGLTTAIATRATNVYGGIAWQPEAILNPRYPENLDFTLGSVGLLVATVPAGQIATVRFAVGFYQGGQATTGINTTFLYTDLFRDVEEVVSYSLNNSERLVAGCEEMDQLLLDRLDTTRATMFGHAVRGYFNSSQLLRTTEGDPLWVVNEGEYRMMNTMDLTVDQIYFELALNPWTVKNELDLLLDRYSYTDQVRFPGETVLYPGGLTFCHDMGVANHFSRQGRSSYEQAGLKGVFSYMSCEELVNWVLCACLYLSHTRDHEWLKLRKESLGLALRSLVNRDHPDPEKRNGVMSLDSSRCESGAEITTYDSLDKSLGQARNNVYLAVKTWAAYALVEEHLRTAGETVLADVAKSQAKLCARTIVESADDAGVLPAIIGEGSDARLIPAIEGLVFPWVAGRTDLISEDGPFGSLRKTLQAHFEEVMSPGVCKFEDGGWKLSSTSKNSWLSKIYLCQAIAEQIFGAQADSEADEIHLGWLMDEDNSYFAWSDQMLAGKAHGSRYYPRGVTSVLWLASADAPLRSIREALAPDTSQSSSHHSSPV